MVCAMTLPRFDFEAPTSLPDACSLLAQSGHEAFIMAGGTDLMVKMKRGELRPRLVISLSRLEGLTGVKASLEEGLRIGPLTTMSQLESSPVLRGYWSSLAEGAGSVGGPLIRNRATVGGNIVNARPCADSVSPLLALGAKLQLLSARGSRTVKLNGFILGPGETMIQKDELVTDILLPIPTGGAGAGAGSCYLKLTRRAAMEVTLVGCAVSVVLDSACHTIEQARIVLASVAPVLLRVPEAEAALAGQQASEQIYREAAALAREAAHPIDDHRAPAFLRAEMVEVLTRRALTIAVERARNASGRLS